MKHAPLLALAILISSPASAQLTVTSHSLMGTWSFRSDDDSFSGEYDIEGSDPIDVSKQSTVMSELFPGFVLDATLHQEIHSEVFANGFRHYGSIVADNPIIPFYEHDHFLSSKIHFELSEPALLRFSGTMLHDPLVGPGGSYVLLNGMSILLNGTDDVGVTAFFQPEFSFDFTVQYSAGQHSLEWDNYSTWVGRDDQDLIGVNSAWDITVEVVPASGSVVPLVFGGVLAFRRRR